ncbi:MAG: hypothetical protein FGM52_04050 [Mycobacterium sp.]|nr:hypothetical protein [Mycobacterium sp.]
MSSALGSALAVAATALTVAAVAVAPAGASPTEGSTDYASDEYGYPDTAARCDDTAVVFGRTAQSLVAICRAPDGLLEYRGVRLSDQAELTLPATRGADGTISADNDGVSYSVSPEALLVSEGDAVLYRSRWLEFGEPGPTDATPSSAPAPSPTASAAPSTPAAPATPSSPTVSTTTVTLSPTESR